MLLQKCINISGKEEIVIYSLKKTEIACQTIKNIIVKIILLCTIILSILILYQNIEVVLSAEIFRVLIYFGAIIASIGFMFYYLKFALPEKIYIVLIIIISLASRLCFTLFVQTPIYSDFLKMYNAAKDVVAGDKSWLGQTYFSTWGYQIPFVYYEAFILKLFGSSLALKLFNVAYMVVINILIYLIAKECTTSYAAFIVAVLYSIYPAPILLSSVLTNQHISLMFFMLSIYFFLIAPSWSRILLSGIFLFLGNLLRPEAVLIITTMLVFTVTSLTDKIKWEYIKNNLLKILSLFVAFIFLTNLSSTLFKITGVAPNGISNSCPEWKFVIGLDTVTNGTYSERNAYIVSIKDSDLRLQEAKKIISTSLQECKSIPLFFWEKLKIMWANMENTSWSLLHIQKDKPILNEITYEEVINNIVYFDKAIYILLHILIITTCIIIWIAPITQNHIPFFFIVLIFVNYIAYLFIEVQTRYRYFIMPSFFISTSVVFDLISKWLKNRQTG